MDERELRGLLLRASDEAAEAPFDAAADLRRGRAARTRRRLAQSGAGIAAAGLAIAVAVTTSSPRATPELPAGTSSSSPSASRPLTGPPNEYLNTGGKYDDTFYPAPCSGWVAFPGDGQRAAVTCDAGTYVSELDQNPPRRVGAGGVGVAWTHDRSRLVVNHNSALEILTPDAADRAPVIVPLPKDWLTMDLDVNADDRAVMVGLLGDASAIMTINLDGSDPVVVAQRRDVQMYAPRWSPDGTRIGYEQRDAKPIVVALAPIGAWTMAADGTDRRLIAQYGKAYLAGGGTSGFAWSASGWMAFAAANGQIAVVSPSGDITLQTGHGPLAWRKLEPMTR